MTPLSSIFQSMPDWVPWVVIFCIGAALVVGVGFNMLMKGFKEFSENLTEMVEQRMAAKQEPAPVAVQQPLVVKPHDGLVSMSDHQVLRKEFEDLREQRRADVHGLHKKIETGLDKVRDDLADEFKDVRAAQGESSKQIAVLQNEAGSLGKQIRALDAKLEDLPERIVKIVDRKGIQ